METLVLHRKYLFVLLENISGLRFRSWTPKRTATAHAFTKFFAFFRCHLLPAFAHSLPPASPVCRTVKATPSSKEQPAQRQQSDRLPKSDWVQSKQARHQPVP